MKHCDEEFLLRKQANYFLMIVNKGEGREMNKKYGKKEGNENFEP